MEHCILCESFNKHKHKLCYYNVTVIVIVIVIRRIASISTLTL